MSPDLGDKSTAPIYLTATREQNFTVQDRLNNLLTNVELALEVISHCDHCTNKLRRLYINNHQEGGLLSEKQQKTDDSNDNNRQPQ
jgi:hypothetical protein